MFIFRAIITPIASAPLVLSLFFQQRKLKKQYKSEYPDEIRAKPKDLSPTKVWKVLKTFWFKLDIGGLIILTAGMSCLLLPLSTPKPGWHGAAVITPISQSSSSSLPNMITLTHHSSRPPHPHCLPLLRNQPPPCTLPPSL